MRGKFGSDAVRRAATIAGSMVLIAFILWVDVRTSVWQNMVILSGLAAGLVTFLLTTLVVNRVIERATERRWAPVTRLALTELMHGLADDDKSDFCRGEVVPRVLSFSAHPNDAELLTEQSYELRNAVVSERKNLASLLGIWAQFLASSGNNETIMRRIASIALQLDAVRDRTLEVEEALEREFSETDNGETRELALSEKVASLQEEIMLCNEHLSTVIDDLKKRLHEAEALEAGVRGSQQAKAVRSR